MSSYKKKEEEGLIGQIRDINEKIINEKIEIKDSKSKLDKIKLYALIHMYVMQVELNNYEG